MDKKKPSWDNVPSLEGLTVDWEFKPESDLGKRNHVRLSAETITTLVEMKKIPIKVATVSQTFTARLHDLGVGGIAIDSRFQLKIKQPVKVGFYLGGKKIIAKATVRWVKQHQSNYRAGIMFFNLNEDSTHYIAGLYAAKKMNKY